MIAAGSKPAHTQRPTEAVQHPWPSRVIGPPQCQVPIGAKAPANRRRQAPKQAVVRAAIGDQLPRCRAELAQETLRRRWQIRQPVEHLGTAAEHDRERLGGAGDRLQPCDRGGVERGRSDLVSRLGRQGDELPGGQCTDNARQDSRRGLAVPVNDFRHA